MKQRQWVKNLILYVFLFSGCDWFCGNNNVVSSLSLSLTDWLKEKDYKITDKLTYFSLRDSIIQSEKEFERRNWFYNENETIVNSYLDHLKWKDKQASENAGFPTFRPIDETLDRIKNSEVFEALRGLPKGGNLHSHENHQVSKRKLLEIIWGLDDFEYFYIVQPGKSKNEWNTDFFVNPPTNDAWIKVKDTNLTIDDLMDKSTLINTMTENDRRYPTDSMARWQRTNYLWNRAGSPIISNIKVRYKYLWTMYNDSYNEGITYLETRRSYDGGFYVLDPTGASSATFGKKYFTDSSVEIDLAVGMAKNFTALYPRFVGHKAITYATRGRDEESFKKALDNSVELRRRYPHHVIGFDAVGEEDAGFSSLTFIDQYLKLFETGDVSVPLYLHSVETNWPIDLMSNNKDTDLVPALENAYESILLSAKRVGHGKGFLKMPYLRGILKEKGVAVEVCVVSNQILGYDADIRNHYGQVLHKEGIPIVLAPDDPAIFGYDTVVVDWYAAYVSWGLNLGDLKQIALNSLTYNGMTDEEREDAIENKWKRSWDEYINEMKRAACRRNYAEEASKENRTVKLIRLFPDRGFENGNVHVYGRNFEVAICKVPKCQFGTETTVNAIYLSNRHLICPVPACPSCQNDTTTQTLRISLDGSNYEPTSLFFTFEKSSSAFKNLCSPVGVLLSFMLIHLMV